MVIVCSLLGCRQAPDFQKRWKGRVVNCRINRYLLIKARKAAKITQHVYFLRRSSLDLQYICFLSLQSQRWSDTRSVKKVYLRPAFSSAVYVVFCHGYWDYTKYHTVDPDSCIPLFNPLPVFICVHTNYFRTNTLIIQHTSNILLHEAGSLLFV